MSSQPPLPSDSRALVAMPPPAPRLPGREHRPMKETHRVMEEDEYVSAVQGIITRDYFPDLPALRCGCLAINAHKVGDWAIMLFLCISAALVL